MQRKAFCLFLAALPLIAAEGGTPSGFLGEFINQLNDTEKKFVGLAEAVPQEKYSWRPGEGVRSVSEVFMHVAGANFMLTRIVGVAPPSGLDPKMEKTVTEKAEVKEMLTKSFAHMRKAAMETKDSDLDSKVKVFGRETTKRDAFLLFATHMHEHLGQSIAYARVNSVVPPWSKKGSD